MSEFLFLHLITHSIKKIPKKSPLTHFSKIFISLSKNFHLPPLQNILCSSLKNCNLLLLEIPYFYKPFSHLNCCSLFSRNFFFSPRALRFHKYSLSLSLSLIFFPISKVFWCPLCAFKNKLRMTEHETLFAIEQVVLKLYFIVMKLLFYNCNFKNNKIG